MLLPDEEIVKRFRAANDKAAALNSLADENQCTTKDIALVLAKNGVLPSEARSKTPHAGGAPRKVDAAEFAELWRQGATDQDLADHFKVSKPYACQYRRNLGLNCNQTPRKKPAPYKPENPADEGRKEETAAAAQSEPPRAVIPYPNLISILTKAGTLCENVRLGGQATGCSKIIIEVVYTAKCCGDTPESATVTLA